MTEQTPADAPRRRLGRGLTALLGGGPPAHDEMPPHDESELRHIAIAAITRNPFQPRKDFDPESLLELSGSIREHGILQPLLVREVDGGVQLIAGERRWQAARKAGLSSVPCRIVDVIDKTACEFALEENLKRKDLNDLEKAQAFRGYLDHFECTIEELAKQLSMSRSSVSNILRLLELTEPVKNALLSGKISSGHARAMLSLGDADQLGLCGRIQAESLSVRQTEAAVREILKPQATSGETSIGGPGDASSVAAAEHPVETQNGGEPAATSGDDRQGTIAFAAEAESLRTAHVDSLEEQLRGLLGLPVEIRLKTKEAGAVVIPFASNDEFQHLLRQLRRAAA